MGSNLNPKEDQFSLLLDPLSVEDIRRHGREAYPHECCGALLGHGELVTKVLALPNTTDEGPRRRFLISPADYQAAEAQASSRGEQLVGFYHSHPDHPARPSEHDLPHAWPVLAYVIISIRKGESGELTSWRLKEDRSAFDQMELTIGEAGQETS